MEPGAKGTDIDIGATVWTADGVRFGSVSAVVIAPDREEVSHIVIRRGAVFPVDVVAAIGDVREVVDHTVRLSITAEEAAHLPNLEGQASEPLEVSDQDASGLGPPSGDNIWASNVPVALPPLVTTATNVQPYVVEGWRNVPEQSLVLREGLPVYTEDGALVGTVDELVMDPTTHAVTHLIVRQVGGAGHDKAIPVGWIERSDEDTGVFLAVQRAEVEGLPDYH